MMRFAPYLVAAVSPRLMASVPVVSSSEIWSVLVELSLYRVPFQTGGSIAKVFCSDTSWEVCNTAMALLGDHDWTRDLRELADRELRLEVLEVLIEMAVADHVLKHDEQTQLRRIAKALSLTQDDYNALQAKHRDKLSTLG